MKRIYFAIVGIFLILATIIAISYAWFVNGDVQTPKVTGYSLAAYFAGGDGTILEDGEDESNGPFIIANSRHLYNLAWLQYLGEFNKVKSGTTDEIDKQYYFVLRNDIDMNGLTIPPIGTKKNPFLGNFDGRGYTIKNLTISNEISEREITRHPSSISSLTSRATVSLYGDVSIVGMFGVVGNYDKDRSMPQLKISSTINEVKNFNIDDIEVRSTSSQTLIGLAAGYVNADFANVGVHYSKMSLAATGVRHITDVFESISGYALIGDYNDSRIGWVDRPNSGSGGQGSDLAYGGNFDSLAFLERLNLIAANKASASASPYLPDLDTTTNENPVPAVGNKLPLTVVPSTVDEDHYTGSDARETVSSQNIGYYIGNQNKIYETEITFTDKVTTPSDTMNGSYTVNGEAIDTAKKTPRQFFKRLGDNQNYQTNSIRPLTDAEFDELPPNIQDLIPDANGKQTFGSIRLSQRFPGNVGYTNTVQNDKWALLGSIEYMGTTYGTTTEPYTTGGIALPNNGIWFRPQKAGKLRFVMYSGSNGESFKLIKITRNSATAENPFNGTDISGNVVTSGDFAHTKAFPKYLLFYYEYEVTEAEIEAGNVEFVLYQGDDNGAYFIYMDIGISGNGEGEEPSPEYEENIVGIDFVYLDPSTEEFNPLTIKSGVCFSVNDISGKTLNSEIVYYFRRNKDEGTNGEDVVLFYPRISETDSLLFQYSATGNKGLATDETCEILDGSVIVGTTPGSGGGGGGISASYTITYNANGHGTAPSSVSGRKIPSTLPVMEDIPGYRFGGWYTDSSCTTAATPGSRINANTTLYAKWTAVATHTVSFVDEGASPVDIPSQVVNDGDRIVLPSPTKMGYTFDGWYTNRALTTAFDETTEITSNITLYAKWSEVSTHTVTFVDASGTVSIDPLEVNDGDTIVITDPTRSGYVFGGWYTNSGLTTPFDPATEITSNITLYAKWIKAYTISFNKNGHGNVPSNIPNVIEIPAELPVLTASGWEFKGWYLEAGCVNPAVAGTPLTANLKLYAKWDETHTITFNVGGIGTAPSSITTSEIPAELPVLSASGYKFDGWFTDSACTVEAVSGTVITANTTLYAKWTEQAWPRVIEFSDGSQGGDEFFTVTNGTIAATQGPVEYNGNTYTQGLDLGQNTTISFDLDEEHEIIIVVSNNWFPLKISIDGGAAVEQSATGTTITIRGSGTITISYATNWGFNLKICAIIIN